MLAAIQVRNAKPKEKPYKFNDGKGFFLHIAKSGKKTWRYRYELPPGMESTFVIGECPVLSLEDARSERMALREKAKQVVKNSFEAVALDWHRHQKDRWTANHAEAVLKSLERYAFEPLSEIQIDQITLPMVLEVVRAIEAKGSLEMASKTLQRIGAVFRFAIQKGRAVYNPAADMRGALKAKKVEHHTMIPSEELPEFLKTLVQAIFTPRQKVPFGSLSSPRPGPVRYAAPPGQRSTSRKNCGRSRGNE